MCDKSRFKTGLLPDHLPSKLSISFWHHWLYRAQPGAPYADLERCVLGLQERGFNAVRVNVPLTYAFRLDGTPRGPIEFEPPFPGYTHAIDKGTGGQRDVLERLIHLLELARKHDVWVIFTDWEYQNSTCVKDPAVHADMAAVADERRFLYLAQHHDRLLTILKAKGLTERIAFVEIHNEAECSALPQGAEGKRLHEEAIAFLRTRHPDILVSADFTRHDYTVVPDNAQVFDQHIYAGIVWHISLYKQTIFDPAVDLHNPYAFEPLRRVLKEEIIPFDAFKAAFGAKTMRNQKVTDQWVKRRWLWENLDVHGWDAFMAETFPEWKDRIWEKADRHFAEDTAEGQRRGLPLVMDEGGFFWPPPNSRWELTADGISLFDHFADLAIQHGYWGFMPGTYCGPEHILWRERPDCLRKINIRFQKGRIGEPADADDA